MARAIRIEKSNKRGFRGQESYIVTRGRTSYLRIVGIEPIYHLMTATASEDDHSYHVCGDRVRLVSSALQLGARLRIPPSPEEDSFGRAFIRICAISFSAGKEQEDLDELHAVLEAFFRIFDTSDPASDEVMSDMQEVYSALSDNNSNEDVYLSDGVWLSFDGKLHERER